MIKQHSDAKVIDYNRLVFPAIQFNQDILYPAEYLIDILLGGVIGQDKE